MIEKKNIIRTLLGVELYEFTENDIYEIRKNHKTGEHFFKQMPKWTLNKNKNDKNNKPLNTIIESNYYLQYVGIFPPKKENNDIKYWLFNFNEFDTLLNIEISEIGIERLVDNIDFEKILLVFKPITRNEFASRIIPNTNYLVFEITYNNYYSDGWETDVSYDIIGYLDENMQLKLYEK